MLEKEEISIYHLAMQQISQRIKIILPLLLFIFVPHFFYSQELDKYQLSSDVLLHSVSVKGIKLFPKKRFLEEIYKLDFPNEVKVNDLKLAEKRVRESGYFINASFRYNYVKNEKGKLGFKVTIVVQEQPVLVKIKHGGDFFADFGRLKKILNKMGIQKGKIFNRVKLEEGLKRFKLYLQNRGVFLFNIRYRIKSDLKEVSNWFSTIFRISDKKRAVPVYLKLYLIKISHFYIRSIKVKGNKKIPAATIIRHFPVKKGQLVSTDQQLFYAAWKLKRLGIFSSVYIDIIPHGVLNKARIVINLDEIESDIVNPSVSLNSREEFNLELDYFNYSIGKSLSRISAGLIFDTRTEDFYFITQFSVPVLFDDYFLNVRLERTATSYTYNDDWDYYNDQLSLSFTFGRRYGRYFSVYARVDNNRTKLFYHSDKSPEPSLPAGLEKSKIFLDQTFRVFLMFDSLDDNFFPTIGVRNFLSFTTSLLSDFDYYSIIDNKLELYFPLREKLTMVFYGHAAILFTSGDYRTLTLEEQRKTTAQDDSAIGLEQTKFTLYGAVEFRYRVYEQFALVAFGETGAAWRSVKETTLSQLSFGLGIGLRIAPRQHYYAHVFKYPWSLNIGFNISNKQDNKPFFSIVSSRDEYYYINLQASF